MRVAIEALVASYHVKAVLLQLSRQLAFSRAEVGELSQHFPSHRSPYPVPRKLCGLLLLLCPYKRRPSSSEATPLVKLCG